MHAPLRSARSLFLPAVLALTLLLAAASPVCLWDTDTLKTEAAGAPGVVEAIVGRFDRFPARYYEMRLERVSGLLATEPDALAAYDDAGVACERLGRGDEAIEWMGRKRAALDRLAARGEVDAHHEYTYLANLGTFHVHRRLRSGAKADATLDLEEGRDLLRAAIELNPDAHFGRERWQLMGVEWLVELAATPLIQSSEVGPAATFLPIGTDGGPWLGRNELEKAGYDDAVEGLVGLITLGSAWESVDVVIALELALIDRGDGHLARVASLRATELLNSGHESLARSGSGLGYDAIELPSNYLYPQDAAKLDAFFVEARASADAWRFRRNEFVLGRLAEGRHPDTDPSFWRGWKDRPAMPTIPGHDLGSWLSSNWEFASWIALGLVASLLVGLVVLAVRIVRRLRRLRRSALTTSA